MTTRKDGEGTGEEGKNPAEPPKDKTEIEEMIAKGIRDGVEEALKPIKGKLDNAYAARDDAQSKVATLEQTQRDVETQRLKDEGKHQEVLERQLEEANTLAAQEKARVRALEDKNTELTRDISLRNALSAHAFRSESAKDMAFREMSSQMVKDEKGQWKHNSGETIANSVKTFLSNEDNSFLLKIKESTGTGSASSRAGKASDTPFKSVFSKTQAQIIAEAQKRVSQ